MWSAARSAISPPGSPIRWGSWSHPMAVYWWAITGLARSPRSSGRASLFFAAENGKPTIAQWSVFLPRLGRHSPAGEPPYSLTASVPVPADVCRADCWSRPVFDSFAITLYGYPRVSLLPEPGSFLSGSRPFTGSPPREGSESAPGTPPGDRALPPRVTGRPPGGGGSRRHPRGWAWDHRTDDCGLG